MRTTTWKTAWKTAWTSTWMLLLCWWLAPSASAGPETTHKEALKTKHFAVHVRPGSRAAAAAELAGARAELALRSICDRLSIRQDGSYRLFLYDDVEELQAVTGVVAAGFAAGVDVHVPHDNLQTLGHEVCHVVTARIKATGTEPRNMFFVEGMANTMLEFVHGVSVDAVAKYYRLRNKLPALASMTDPKDFYAWMRLRPRFNAYDVAASYLKFLLDTYGAKKTVRYYTGTSATKSLGASEATLEQAWHEHLDAFVLRPEVETLLALRHQEDVAFSKLPSAGTLDPASIPASQFERLSDASLVPERSDSWVREGKTIKGTHQGSDWSWCTLGSKTRGDGILRAVIRIQPGTLGVAVRLGASAQAMLVNGRGFLYTTGNQPRGGATDVRAPTGTVTLCIARVGNTAAVWVNGKAWVQAMILASDGLPGIGVAGGVAVVESVAFAAQTEVGK